MKKNTLIPLFLVIIVVSVSLTTAVGQSTFRVIQTSVKEEQRIEKPEQNTGILPAFVLVKCKWNQEDKGAGERTIHFWVFGVGHHVLEWRVWDDHDGDGNWDLWGPYPPWHEEWTSLFFPIRHFDNWVSWSGYTPDQGDKPKVKVEYWIDGESNVKTFEPKTW